MAEVRPLADGEHAAAYGALAAAFDADPMFEYLLPSPRKRARWLPAFFCEALRQCHGLGTAFVTSEGPAAGALGLVDAGHYPPPQSSVGVFLGLGERPFPGLPTWRLLRAGLRVFGDMARIHPSDPHLYVMVVGVDPSRKGQGLGKAFMEFAAARADAAGVPAYLETTNPVNLPFYRRFGFETVDERNYPGGAPTLWTMQRPA